MVVFHFLIFSPHYSSPVVRVARVTWYVTLLLEVLYCPLKNKKINITPPDVFEEIGIDICDATLSTSETCCAVGLLREVRCFIFTQIHLGKLPSELFSAGRNMIRPTGVL